MSDSMLAIPAVSRPAVPVVVTRAHPGRILRRRILVSAALAALLPATGCIFGPKKQTRVFVPPPPKRLDPAALKPPPVMEAPVLAAKNPDVLRLEATIGIEIPEFPPPPPPAPPPRNRPAAAAAKPTMRGPEPETASVPKITQIFTPEQLRDYTRTLDDSIDRVEKALDTLGKRSLNAEQRDRMEQIQDFLKQARQARDQDLVTAVNLAKHADGLAKDLLERLQ